MTTELNFPVYRKYKNGKSYFKIISATNFTEVQMVGNKKMVHHITANTYPEKLLIHDMLHNFSAHWDAITEAEFEMVL
jgi:hypothetical protein